MPQMWGRGACHRCGGGVHATDVGEGCMPQTWGRGACHRRGGGVHAADVGEGCMLHCHTLAHC